MVVFLENLFSMETKNYLMIQGIFSLVIIVKIVNNLYDNSFKISNRTLYMRIIMIQFA